MSRKRYTSIECLKGLGIIYLIGLHEWVWMWLDLSQNAIRWKEIETGFPYFGYFGLHVLGFEVPLLAGITFYVATTRKKSSIGFVANRALGLATLGYLINFLCWGVYGVSDWDVLHFIALAMVLTYPFIRGIKGVGGALLPLLLGCAALLFSNRYPWQEFSDNYFYAIVVGSSSGEHFWPLCPWLFVFTAGLMIGYILESANRTWFQALLPVGLILMISAILAGDYHPVVTTALWGGDMFKASPFYILGIVGTSMVFICLLESLFRARPAVREACEKSVVVMMGRSILWLFLLNTIVGYHATRWVLTNFTLTFPQALGAYLGLVAGTLIVGCVIAFVVQQRRKVVYA